MPGLSGLSNHSRDRKGRLASSFAPLLFVLGFWAMIRSLRRGCVRGASSNMSVCGGCGRLSTSERIQTPDAATKLAASAAQRRDPEQPAMQPREERDPQHEAENNRAERCAPVRRRIDDRVALVAGVGAYKVGDRPDEERAEQEQIRAR